MTATDREKILRLLILRGWVEQDDEQAVRETIGEALGDPYHEEDE